MGLERLVVPIEWKATDDDQTLEGYASTFGNVDLGGDVVVKGAFAKTVANINSNGIPLLADHVASTASVLGTIYQAKEDETGLRIKARFSKAPSAQDVRTKLLEGHLRKMSIGYEVMDDAWEDREGQRVRLLKDVKLWETSVVVFPMNPEAAISRVKSVADSLSPEDRKHLVEALADAPEDAVCIADGCQAEPTHKHTPDGSETAVMVCEQHKDSPGDEPGAAGDEPVDKAADPAAAPSDEPGETPDEGVKGWDRWTSAAVMNGRDPEAKADPAKRAGMATQLELLEADVERSRDLLGTSALRVFSEPTTKE